jgi:hypothetical protein
MIYNQFSTKYNQTYLQNLLEFQCRASQFYCEGEYFVDFYPSFGTKPGGDTDFLVYGQAVGGWGTGIGSHTPLEHDKLEKSITFSNSYCGAKGHCPLDWVNVQWTKTLYTGHMSDPILRAHYEIRDPNYWAHRSFFWNTTFKTISDYYSYDREDWDWTKQMVWSNLYKIAPEESNPNQVQMLMQQPLAYELVKLEIEELQPKYCIVLTNREWWLPFGYYLNTKPIEYDKSLFGEIVSLEQYQSTIIIVTSRPRWGTGEVHAKHICDLLKSKNLISGN